MVAISLSSGRQNGDRFNTAGRLPGRSLSVEAQGLGWPARGRNKPRPAQVDAQDEAAGLDCPSNHSHDERLKAGCQPDP